MCVGAQAFDIATQALKVHQYCKFCKLAFGLMMGANSKLHSAQTHWRTDNLMVCAICLFRLMPVLHSMSVICLVECICSPAVAMCTPSSGNKHFACAGNNVHEFWGPPGLVADAIKIVRFHCHAVLDSVHTVLFPVGLHCK